MIICDRDNIDGSTTLPRRETIDEEWRRQTEALKDLRRRLEKVTAPKPLALLRPRA